MVTKIEDCVCTVTDALGMGSFGTVWAAEDQSSGVKLAVKEIACWSHNELMNALFERHLLRVLSETPVVSTTPATTPIHPPAGGSTGDGLWQWRSNGQGPSTTGRGIVGVMPSLVGHEVITSLQPKRVRLAMTRVPGVALEDFLEERRCVAAAGNGAGLRTSPRQRFGEACRFAHALLSQLAPVFETISAIAIHRDVNTHNILIDSESIKSGTSSTDSVPRYGLVDFGLAVDTICWCSTESNPETKWRPTRVGVDAVHTWRYLDIAGDCRYWPVSAWTQFLIGWKEIDASPCLRREYQVQLDQHALGITAMKVFVELLSPPPPREPRDAATKEEGANNSHGSLESSDIPSVQMEIWTLLRAWERYWRRISPVHKKLISTFHHGGDWEVLKKMCEDTNFYDNIARDLRSLREAIHEASKACQLAGSKNEDGCNEPGGGENPVMFATATKLFEAMLLLISDGVTQGMLYGPEAWYMITSVLQGGEAGAAPSEARLSSPELPTASTCSSNASTAEAPPDRRKELHGTKKLYARLPS